MFPIVTCGITIAGPRIGYGVESRPERVVHKYDAVGDLRLHGKIGVKDYLTQYAHSLGARGQWCSESHFPSRHTRRRWLLPGGAGDEWAGPRRRLD